jgi:pimeloyl-ACP methyl ester carboxylesterase
MQRMKGDHVDLGTRAEGEGTPVALVHGIPGSSAVRRSAEGERIDWMQLDAPDRVDALLLDFLA